VHGPLVIGHRGASGHRPEHTSLAYRLAWRSGADCVETDVVSSRDGVLLCRHDLDLARTTDIAERPEFAHRRHWMQVDGEHVQGWFVGDLDLDELRTLRARERWPALRPASARYDDKVGLLTLDDLLDLRERESARAGRRLGVHVEVKEPETFERGGLPLHEPLVQTLRDRGLTTALSPVAVMSFDARLLKQVRRHVDVDLVRLLDHDQPVRRGSLARTASYATGVGLHKAHLRRGKGRHPARVAGKVQAAGLDLLVWTLRSENRYLPAHLREPGTGATHGRAHREVARLLDLGVDGLITDFPEVAAGVLANRAGRTVRGDRAA
jgi:glycerophosphoryl diester phosphodiesterase